MKRYAVRLTGVTPLLMHADDVRWSEILTKFQKDPATKKISVAGDDRSPAWTWLGYLYHSGGIICLPSDNLMTMIRDGAKQCPTGKGKGTFKSLSQSGMVVDQAGWPLVVNGKTLNYKEIYGRLIEELDYSKHEETALEYGFELFAKRARVGTSKHVRVRPRFDNWTAEGSITVLEDQITRDVLKNILSFAGAYSGICDWRPASPSSPGRFGCFTVQLEEMS